MEYSQQIPVPALIKFYFQFPQIASDDEAIGYIYILRSLSKDPQIKEIKDLYKIGYSNQPVRQLIQNAKQDPTYLMADVMPATEYQAYNLNPQKLEFLLHTFLRILV